MKTPRLRALLMLYLAVACASAMLIVNTVVYVKDVWGGTDSQVASAFAAAGFGSMLAASAVPRLVDRFADKVLMIGGAPIMAAGVLGIALNPDLTMMLPVWFTIGLGWSLVQTPAGRVVNRSARPDEKSAFGSSSDSNRSAIASNVPY